MDTLGWIYRDSGQLEKSVELLRDALRQAPQDNETRYHYAVVLVESGDKERGREILTSLTNSEDQFPSRELAEQLLREL